MGVRGLRSFIREKVEKLLSDFRLQDTKLIVDGSNLVHFLYKRFHVPHEFAGDFNHFSEKCREFFKKLAKCNITPIVVFDGAYERNDRKWSTVIKRLNKQYEKVKSGDCKDVLPLLSKETLREVLVELNVAHLACFFEADREIAVLANKMNCPVLSNDSDFYVFNLRYGLVSIDCIFEPELTDSCGKPYIPVNIYTYESFLEEVFKKEAGEEYIVPVFATLGGNDIFDSSKLKLKHPTDTSDVLHCNGGLQGIVDWLCRAGFTSGLAACKYISGQIPGDLKKKFQTSVDSYRDIWTFAFFNLEAFLPVSQNSESETESENTDGVYTCSTIYKRDHNEVHVDDTKERKEIQCTVYKRDHNEVHVDDYKERKKSECMIYKRNHKEIHVDDSKERKEIECMKLEDFNGQCLPSWLVHGVIKCKMDCSFFLNIALNHRLTFKTQIENVKKPSSYACSKGIRRVIYRIVMVKVRRGIEEKTRKGIKEYDRSDSTVSNVNPIDRLPGINKLPELQNIPNLEESKRKEILYATFGSMSFDDDEDPLIKDMDDTSIILVLMLTLWKVNSCASNCSLNALIIGIMALQICHPETKVCTDILRASVNVKRDQLDGFKKHVRQLFSKGEYEGKIQIEWSLSHELSQFQSCYLHVKYLNQLLLNPVHIPSPEMILDGTFVYNIREKLKEPGSEPENILCGRESSLFDLFNKWKIAIEKLCEKFVRPDCPVAFPTKELTKDPQNRFVLLSRTINNVS